VGELSAKLEARGFGLDPAPGLPDFLIVREEPYPISRTLEHWLGLFYLQQAATGAAALALGAVPGERILDLCAAPGGKTTHVAERMGGSGTVVASDNSPGRVRALLGNLYRLGHANVMAVTADGRALPDGALFDRALVDAPCSGEGNPRRRRGSRSAAITSEGFRGHITGVQRGLLRRAVELVRPGGTILYATCTSAVEENEAVVARALARLPVSVEEIRLDLPHDAGVTVAGGRALPHELALSWRVGAAHVGSGSLFMARLRREPGGPGGCEEEECGWRAVPGAYEEGTAVPPLPENVLDEALQELRRGMGVSDGALSGARWMIRGDSVWMHRAPAWPLDTWEKRGGAEARWRFISLGVRAFQRESCGRLRPTNDLLRALDGALRDRTVELAAAEALALLERGDAGAGGFADGYVALRVEGRVVGRGFARGGRLRPEVPRPEAKLLEHALRASAAR
jgi:16S rRNA C967 or C1407 C5-methylase (RsmB/RsmF family)